MQPSDLDDCTPNQLANMLSFDTTSQQVWLPSDLAAILNHQLSLPPSGEPPGARDVGEPAGEDDFSDFWQLFRSPQPSLLLLKQIKDACKTAVRDADAPLPDEVATVLYFVTIAVALVRCGERLTRLSDEGIQLGLKWSLEQAWVPDELQGHLVQAMRIVGPVPGSDADDAPPP